MKYLNHAKLCNFTHHFAMPPGTENHYITHLNQYINTENWDSMPK